MNERMKDATRSVQRAYSVIEMKSMKEDGDLVLIEGIATTPAPDRMGDVVEPDGAKFKLPIPLLWQHAARQPIGMVEEATKGSRSLRFKEWEWLELSAVTIPANAEASIQSVKKFDTDQKAASGPPGDDPPPGATGKQNRPASSGFFFAHSSGTKMKTYQERIQAIEAAMAPARRKSRPGWTSMSIHYRRTARMSSSVRLAMPFSRMPTSSGQSLRTPKRRCSAVSPSGTASLRLERPSFLIQ